MPLLKKLSLRRMPSRYNTLWKPTLLKWDQNSYFKSSHDTNLSYSPNHLLPIQHFRFSGTFRRKIKLGLQNRTIIVTQVTIVYCWSYLRSWKLGTVHFFTENQDCSKPLKIILAHAIRLVCEFFAFNACRSHK